MTYNHPKVSVVLPVHNNADSVHASLESLFKQTLREIEVIAVNDASTDESGAVLDEIASTEPRLHVIHLEKNGGTYNARSAGLKVAKAPWVGFLDADDFARSQMYELMHRACDQDQLDVAICGIDLVTKKREFLSVKVSFQRKETITESIFERFCAMDFGTGSICNKLYKRELLLKHAMTPFRWRQDASEDTLVNLGCFADALKVKLLDEQLYEYVVNPESATRRIDSAKSYYRMLRAYAVAIDIYQVRGKEALHSITELYSKQLSYDCYHVAQIQDLNAYEKGLSEAVQLLAKLHPMGLISMVNTRRDKVRRQSLALAIRDWWRSL